MDRHFLEFWGNFLLQAAKGQKQLEDLAKWTKRVSPIRRISPPCFARLTAWSKPSRTAPIINKSGKRPKRIFETLSSDYLSLLGVVPREEYAELARKYEELKEKVAEQEETIKLLRQLLSDKGLDYAVVTLEFQKLMEKQGEQFQELMKDVGEAL